MTNMLREPGCRVCSGPPILPLFELHEGILLGQVMADFANVLISEDDGKSAYLCEDCGHKLKLSVEFQNQVKEAEKNLEPYSIYRTVTEDTMQIKLETSHEDEDVYEYEFLDELPDTDSKNNQVTNKNDSPALPAMENEHLLESSDNDEDLSFDLEENGGIVLEDEQIKFPFVMPSEERIAQRFTFDDFEYLEIDGDRCCGCSFIAANRDELMHHSKNTHSQNYYADSGYTCPTCYQKFQSQERLANHIEYYSYSDIFLCTICNESFVQKSQLKAHQDSSPLHQPQKPDDSQPVKCRPSSAYSNKRSIQVPSTGEANLNHYCCFVRCWAAFNTDEELLMHVRQFHEGKLRENELASSKNTTLAKFTCMVCQRSFDTERQLLFHLSYKQKRSDYICQQCGRIFPKAILLLDHEKKEHSNLSPEYECDICGKAFWKLSVLKGHQKIHVPFENVPCSEPGCEMIFRDTALMKRHCRNVHSAALWHCRFCPKQLRTKEALDIHERIHTGEKPFHCRHGCDRKFAHATDRVRHERSMHTKEKPHKCVQCNAAFVRRRELVMHLQKHHNSDEN